MVATRLKAEAIALQQCEIDETRGFPSTDRIVFGGATGSTRPFIVLPATLVNLHDRLHYRIVIPPVGAHPRRAAMRCANAIKEMKVFVEHLRIRRVPGKIPRRDRQPRKRANAATSEDHISMSLREPDAALVGEESIKPLRQVKGV